jgi:hypothetical protein
MSIEEPTNSPVQEKSEKETSLSNSLESASSENVKKGASFLQRTGAVIEEGVKLFFSLPEQGKIINILEKAYGVFHMGLWLKVAMHQRFNEIVTTPGGRQRLALAAVMISTAGIPVIMHAILGQYEEKKERYD